MINDKGILIKNIFYMLTFVLKPLNWNNYKNISVEEFDNVRDLLACILGKGIAMQVKQGLYRSYVDISDVLSGCKGRININETIKLKQQNKNNLYCEYDELSINNIYNQILKSTSVILIKNGELNKENKQLLIRNLLYFDSVDEIDITKINFSKIKFTKDNKNYVMLMNICYLIKEGLLINKDEGNYKMADILNDFVMEKLYEDFIFEYFKQTYKKYLNVNRAIVKWDTKKEDSYLPAMKTDITLTSKKDSEKALIIDAKYYGKTMQKQFDRVSYHSGNMYQIYSYVQNYDNKNNKKTAGMLLYARTIEEIIPNSSHIISGNKFTITTLDLNQKFDMLSNSLNNIANDYFELNGHNNEMMG